MTWSYCQGGDCFEGCMCVRACVCVCALACVRVRVAGGVKFPNLGPNRVHG